MATIAKLLELLPTTSVFVGIVVGLVQCSRNDVVFFKGNTRQRLMPLSGADFSKKLFFYFKYKLPAAAITSSMLFFTQRTTPH
jgi:hypothetical protein